MKNEIKVSCSIPLVKLCNGVFDVKLKKLAQMMNEYKQLIRVCTYTGFLISIYRKTYSRFSLAAGHNLALL
jgi:hypothetical protein